MAEASFVVKGWYCKVDETAAAAVVFASMPAPIAEYSVPCALLPLCTSVEQANAPGQSC